MYYTECTQMLQIKYRVHNMTINYLRSIIIIKKNVAYPWKNLPKNVSQIL